VAPTPPAAPPNSDNLRTRKRGPQPPLGNARSTRVFLTRYFFAGAAGAAAFADAPLAAGAAAFAGAAAATTVVGPICGVTALPFAFCSAM